MVSSVQISKALLVCRCSKRLKREKRKVRKGAGGKKTGEAEKRTKDGGNVKQNEIKT